MAIEAFSSSAATSSMLNALHSRDIITGTLDTLNSDSKYRGFNVKSMYDFQQDVLKAHYTEQGLGAVLSLSA